jgi:RNA polymerase sigma-70 factor, ECF subfamily
MMSFTAINSLPGETEAGGEPAGIEPRFHRLLGENGAALGRLAASYARSPGDRDDLLQEIAMGIWQALPGFRAECSERTFLFRIAHNRAIAYSIRHRSRGEIPDAPLDTADPAPDPEAALVREESGERLSRAVRALPITFRQVVVLLLEGLEYGEIAEIMGISQSNVGARLTRARKLLREIMGGGQ